MPTKAELLQLKLIHLFARATILMKNKEIKKTKPTFIISLLKVEYYKLVHVVRRFSYMDVMTKILG